MLFNSAHFVLLFFPIVVLGYFCLSHRLRWAWLLLASCYFYMAFIPYYILILAFTILVDYVAGLLIANAAGRRRRVFLICSIIANVGTLAVFKYFNFFNANLSQLAHAIGWNYGLHSLSLILPIGLSFHTFQSMSYTIEVYRGRQQPEKHLGIFALYVLFFPQLVAGPIERPQHLLHQFHERHVFDYERVRQGILLMLWGFFQKMAIADRLAPIVDRIYSDPAHYRGLPLAAATVLFAFQILCDFAGYSEIAIGAAKVMGFTLMKNFRQPYLATSVAEFWKRWHISLSSWFRDYLYIPLGGNRVGALRYYSNILIVFTVSGLWHGANWTFVVWGALNGLFLIAGELLKRGVGLPSGLWRSTSMARLAHVGKIACTFVLVCITWIFFRAPNVSQALFVIRNIIPSMPAQELKSIGTTPLITSAVLIVFFLLVSVARERISLQQLLSRQPGHIRWLVYGSAVCSLLLMAEFSSRDFIYFQF